MVHCQLEQFEVAVEFNEPSDYTLNSVSRVPARPFFLHTGFHQFAQAKLRGVTNILTQGAQRLHITTQSVFGLRNRPLVSFFLFLFDPFFEGRQVRGNFVNVLTRQP